MHTFAIVLLLIETVFAKSLSKNITIKIGHITNAKEGLRETEATIRYAIRKIRQLRLINDSVQFE